MPKDRRKCRAFSDESRSSHKNTFPDASPSLRSLENDLSRLSTLPSQVHRGGKLFPQTNEPHHEDSSEDVTRQLFVYSNKKNGWTEVKIVFASDLDQSWISKGVVQRHGLNMKACSKAKIKYAHLEANTIEFLGRTELQWSEDGFSSNFETCRVLDDTSFEIYLKFSLLPDTISPSIPIAIPKTRSSSAPNVMRENIQSTPSPPSSILAGWFESAVSKDNTTDSESADAWMSLHEKHVLRRIEKKKHYLRRKPSVKIAVLDSGVDVTHEFIDGAIKANRIEVLDSFVKGDMINGDNFGHGTHVAALLLEVAPEAQIYSLKIAENGDIPGGHRIVEAIEAAIKLKVDIITMSFGLEKDDADVQRAIRMASAANILMFAAASNNGGNHRVTYPARKDEVICIYSTDGNGNCSGRNPTQIDSEYHFATLGVSVNSAYPKDLLDVAEGESLGESDSESEPPQRRMTGTSIATPIAAAIAACILEFALMNDVPEDVLDALKSRQGMRDVLAGLMVDKNPRAGFHYIHPWSMFDNEDRTDKEIVVLMTNILKP